MQHTGHITPSAARPQAGALLELLKPITWFPPMWAFLCGSVSAGIAPWDKPLLLLAGIVLTGPLVCGASQIVNDWFDREVDAINEPQRPIPSGRAPGNSALWFAIIWTTLAMTWGALLGTSVALATCIALALAWAYSAPPLRLKQNGWWGNSAVGISYEGLAWVTGTAVMMGGAVPPAPILLVALLYSIGAHGIMTLNDFKSIEGDLEVGLRSLPAMLGADRAAKLACVVMALPQLAVIGLLVHWQSTWQAAGITLLLAAQLFAMARLLRDPKALAPWYNGTGVTAYVLGMMLTATAMPGVTAL